MKQLLASTLSIATACIIILISSCSKSNTDNNGNSGNNGNLPPNTPLKDSLSIEGTWVLDNEIYVNVHASGRVYNDTGYSNHGDTIVYTKDSLYSHTWTSGFYDSGPNTFTIIQDHEFRFAGPYTRKGNQIYLPESGVVDTLNIVELTKNRLSYHVKPTSIFVFTDIYFTYTR